MNLNGRIIYLFRFTNYFDKVRMRKTQVETIGLKTCGNCKKSPQFPERMVDSDRFREYN